MNELKDFRDFCLVIVGVVIIILAIILLDSYILASLGSLLGFFIIVMTLQGVADRKNSKTAKKIAFFFEEISKWFN